MLRCALCPSQGSGATRRDGGARRDREDATEVGATVLEGHPLLGIVRARERGDLDGALGALASGGIGLLEVTIDTPGALEAVGRMAANGRVLGVGTVVEEDQVRAAADAGARFVVSPGLLPRVVEAAHELGMEAIPGVLTPTEILAALALGASTMKLFPATTVGPDGLRALRGPFPHVRFVPTGGIGIEDVHGYLSAGAACVGLGGCLVGAGVPRSPGDLDAIRSRAADAVSRVPAGPERGASS